MTFKEAERAVRLLTKKLSVEIESFQVIVAVGTDREGVFVRFNVPLGPERRETTYGGAKGFGDVIVEKGATEAFEGEL